MGKKDYNTSIILGLRVNITSKVRVLKLLTKWAGEKGLPSEVGKKMVFTPNPEMVMKAQEDKEFLETINQGDLNIPDGGGLRLADRRLGERVSGAEIMEEVLRRQSMHDWRVVLLGGRPGAAVKAAAKWGVTGFAGPVVGADGVGKDNDYWIGEINKIKPHFLFVGFGMGKQEKWIVKNLPKLEVKVAMGVGGAIDQQVYGYLQAPKWVKKIGLEWLYRLMVEPRRIFRQLSLVNYVIKVLKLKNE